MLETNASYYLRSSTEASHLRSLVLLSMLWISISSTNMYFIHFPSGQNPSIRTVTWLSYDKLKWTNWLIFYLGAKLEWRGADFMGCTHGKIKLMNKIRIMVSGDVERQRHSFPHFPTGDNKYLFNSSAIHYLCWQLNKVMERLHQLIGLGIQYDKTWTVNIL